MITHLCGDCRDILPTLPAQSVRSVVTSPPYYGLRDYGMPGQIGLEPTPCEYVQALVGVFREVRRLLADDGTLWLNLGDSYASDTKWGGSTSGKHAGKLHGDTGIGRRRTATGLPDKSLMGIPWRVAFALQDDGWILRSDIIWHKPNAMPESIKDRPTRAHEYLFLLSKQPRYYYDADAITEQAATGYKGSSFTVGKTHDAKAALKPVGQRPRVETDTRNKRSVWSIATRGYADAHFAVMPEALVEPCILAGSAPGDTILDPFGGSGTVGRVALKHQRKAVLIELNADYIELQNKRTDGVQVVLEGLL